MKLKEWIANKVSELLDQKYREVAFKSAKECKLSRRATSYELFTAKDIDLAAEIKDVDRASLPDTYRSEEYVPGVMVTLEVIKPRKRKAEREYFYVVVA